MIKNQARMFGWHYKTMVYLRGWFGRLQLVTKDDGLEIHNFLNGKNIQFLGHIWHIILLCKVVNNNCRWFFQIEGISSFLKNDFFWKHWLYCFMYGFECSIFIIFNPNYSTCSQNILETFPCKPIKDLQHKYSFWPKSMQNQTLVTLVLVLISVNGFFFFYWPFKKSSTSYAFL